MKKFNLLFIIIFTLIGNIVYGINPEEAFGLSLIFTIIGNAFTKNKEIRKHHIESMMRVIPYPLYFLIVLAFTLMSAVGVLAPALLIKGWFGTAISFNIVLYIGRKLKSKKP